MNKYEKREGQLVDIEQGEIIATDEMAEAVNEESKQVVYKNNLLLQSMGLKTEYRITKTQTGEPRPSVPIKKDFLFIKVFRTDVREMFKMSQLSVYAKGFIATFQPYLHFPSNSILVDSENPTIETMCDLVGIKKTKMGDVLKELENNNIIIRKKQGSKLIIYFNPFLYSSGGVVDKDTYDLFKNSIFNPLNQRKANKDNK